MTGYICYMEMNSFDEIEIEILPVLTLRVLWQLMKVAFSLSTGYRLPYT